MLDLDKIPTVIPPFKLPWESMQVVIDILIFFWYQVYVVTV